MGNKITALLAAIAKIKSVTASGNRVQLKNQARLFSVHEKNKDAVHYHTQTYYGNLDPKAPLLFRKHGLLPSNPPHLAEELTRVGLILFLNCRAR